MKNTTLPGVVLLILGAVFLIYHGFYYTKTEKVLEIGPAKIEAQTRHDIPVPPILGWIVVAGGAALLVNGLRQRA